MSVRSSSKQKSVQNNISNQLTTSNKSQSHNVQVEKVLKKQNDELEKEIDQKLKKRKQIRDEVFQITDDYKKQLIQQKSQQRNMKQELVSLNENLQKIEVENRQLKQSYMESQNKLAVLERELKFLDISKQGISEDYQTNLNQEGIYNQLLKDELFQKEDQLNLMQFQLNQLQLSCKQLKDQVDELSQQVTDKENEIKEIEKDNKESVRVVKEYQQEAKMLKNAIIEQEQQTKLIKLKIDEVVHEKNHLETRINSEKIQFQDKLNKITQQREKFENNFKTNKKVLSIYGIVSIVKQAQIRRRNDVFLTVKSFAELRKSQEKAILRFLITKEQSRFTQLSIGFQSIKNKVYDMKKIKDFQQELLEQKLKIKSNFKSYLKWSQLFNCQQMKQIQKYDASKKIYHLYLYFAKNQRLNYFKRWQQRIEYDKYVKQSISRMVNHFNKFIKLSFFTLWKQNNEELNNQCQLQIVEEDFVSKMYLCQTFSAWKRETILSTNQRTLVELLLTQKVQSQRYNQKKKILKNMLIQKLLIDQRKADIQNAFVNFKRNNLITTKKNEEEKNLEIGQNCNELSDQQTNLFVQIRDTNIKWVLFLIKQKVQFKLLSYITKWKYVANIKRSQARLVQIIVSKNEKKLKLNAVNLWAKQIRHCNQHQLEAEKYNLQEKLELKQEIKKKLNFDLNKLNEELKIEKQNKINQLFRYFEKKQIKLYFKKYNNICNKVKLVENKLRILTSIIKSFYVKNFFAALALNSRNNMTKKHLLGKIVKIYERLEIKILKQSFNDIQKRIQQRQRFEKIILKIKNVKNQSLIFQAFQRIKIIPLNQKLKIKKQIIDENTELINELSLQKSDLSDSLQKLTYEEQNLLKRNCQRKKFILFKFIKNQTQQKLQSVLNIWKRSSKQQIKYFGGINKLFIIFNIMALRIGMNSLKFKIHNEKRQQLLKEINVSMNKSKTQQQAAQTELGILGQKLNEKKDQTNSLSQYLNRKIKKNEQNVQQQINYLLNQRNKQIMKYIFSAWKSNSKMNVIALKIMDNIIKQYLQRTSFKYLKDSYYQQKILDIRHAALRKIAYSQIYFKNIQRAFTKWMKKGCQIVEQELFQGLDLEQQVEEKINKQSSNQLDAILFKIIQQRQRNLQKNIIQNWSNYKNIKVTQRNQIKAFIKSRTQKTLSNIFFVLLKNVQISRKLKKIKHKLTHELQNEKLKQIAFYYLKERHFNLKVLCKKLVNLIQNRVQKSAYSYSLEQIRNYIKFNKKSRELQRNAKLLSIQTNLCKKQLQNIQIYFNIWNQKANDHKMQEKQFTSIFNHLEKRIKISFFLQFKQGLRKLKDQEKYNRFSEQAQQKREIKRNISCLMDFIKEERINPKEVEEFIKYKENQNAQRLQKCVTYFMLKCTSGNKNDSNENLLLPKAFNTWVSYYKYNKNIKKGLHIISKIIQNRELNLIFLIFKNKNKEFIEKVKKMTRPQLIQKMKYLYQYSSNMEDFVNENYGIIQNMQASNQILSDGYKIGLKICLRYLSRKVQGVMQKGFNIWKQYNTQCNLNLQDRQFEYKSQDIIRLQNHINIMKQKISIIQNENLELKQNCLQGQELSKSLQKILQEREKFSIDLAEKSYTLQILIEDNKSLKQKLHTAQKQANQMMHEYQLQQALAESTIMSQNISRIQE
ncbi:hypothetical protein TTHERM_00444150 (macronuclear) [Tetrahymena thermophila SB210]|uniref:Uncharacterized protein n=1 Tax=Tetrahymena thermophila (strain SB210) TaxID=312017 RepID=I7LWX4_TETTS|nr:hypothetical protein TTHERM_00444150 [Tetrahymena thermophila SB210]EAS03032.2 hypothetical protein TTHERM_00444150 [Tetrahymena thermophila SB210]|eukprot:XP_001023277.2 hypothetical protein TTHERM_00444150 [Tetrahymena thermophila SB210]